MTPCVWDWPLCTKAAPARARSWQSPLLPVASSLLAHGTGQSTDRPAFLRRRRQVAVAIFRPLLPANRAIRANVALRENAPIAGARMKSRPQCRNRESFLAEQAPCLLVL